MEWLLPALFGFIGVFLGGVFSYWGIKKQVEHSDKRFEKELARQREVDERQRRWEVRSEPLLKMRAELTKMTTKMHMFVGTQMQDEGGENKELQSFMGDWTVYVTKGDFLQAINLQYDADLLERVGQIRIDYLLLAGYAQSHKSLTQDEWKRFRGTSRNVETEIPEVQKLINKLLEEL